MKKLYITSASRLSNLNWPFPVVNGKTIPFIVKPKHQYPLTYEESPL